MSFVRLRIPLDPTPLIAGGITFHRTYTKPQRYNRKFTEPHTFTPADTYTLNDAQEASVFLTELCKAFPALVEVPHLGILKIEAGGGENPMLPPHVDYGRTCAINFYVQVNGEVTEFFIWDETSRTVKLESSFVAPQFSWWLLDTTVPHTVRMRNDSTRLILTFSFYKTTFNDVKAIFESALPTGNKDTHEFRS